MKVSLKAREEQRPLLRAKLPLNVLGLPLFTGFTSGDEQDLALHLGTHFQAGPAFRVSYKPNNGPSPFSVLAKTGFGFWGSPDGAALALSAEFNLSSDGSPTFSIRVKPRLGDFGFRKHIRSFKASFEKADRIGHGVVEEQMEVSRANGEGKDKPARLASGNPRDEAAVATPNGSSANGHHYTGVFGNGLTNGFIGKTGSLESERESTEISKHVKSALRTGPHDGNYEIVDDEPEADTDGDKATLNGEKVSWVGDSAKGWSTSAHSTVPIGRWAVAKARWQMKFGSNLFHDLRHGLHISDVKLPSLSVDKVSFETLDPSRIRRSSSDVVLHDEFGYQYPRSGEDSEQLGRIVDLCASMRYQLHLLHLENKVLKNSFTDLRGDLTNRRPAAKGSELMIQEENVLRSQLFDELHHGKSGSKAREGSHGKGLFSKGDSQDLSKSDGAKSAISESTISADTSEELKRAIMNAAGG